LKATAMDALILIWGSYFESFTDSLFFKKVNSTFFIQNLKSVVELLIKIRHIAFKPFFVILQQDFISFKIGV